MSKVTVKRPHSVVIFLLGLVLTFYCSGLVYNNLRAYLFYRQAVSLEKPALKSRRAEYYNQAISLISRAVSYNKSNAEYLAKKADYVWKALDDDFGGRLLLKTTDIEALYSEAIRLNPVNFAYRLKLGWFYSQTNNQKAEGELKRAVSLYPLGAQGYALLAKHYLAKADYAASFGSLIAVSQYSLEEWYNLIGEIEEQINNSPIILNRERRFLSLNLFPQTYEFEFKEVKFPHVKIPIKIRVYASQPQVQPKLYRGHIPYHIKFTKLAESEINVYELSVGGAEDDAYLDEFIIKTFDYSPIEKIEIIKYF